MCLIINFTSQEEYPDNVPIVKTFSLLVFEDALIESFSTIKKKKRAPEYIDKHSVLPCFSIYLVDEMEHIPPDWTR